MLKNKKIPEIGIGMLGYAFMGKAHTNGYKKMPYIFWPPPAIPKLIKICGRKEQNVREAALRYGYSEYCLDWHNIIEDQRISIFVNCGPNNTHAKTCIEAAKAGKNIVCEKPLGRNAIEAKEMLDAVNDTGVKHICNFNFRMIPALILGKKFIMEGKIGKILHFRARYLQEWLIDKESPFIWRLNKKISGSGALGDIGSHIIDLGRFLCGEFKSVTAVSQTFIKERYSEESKKVEKVDVDDAIAAAVEFENGAIGTIEASRFCAGRKNYNVIEVNGEKGSIYWDLENMNNLHVYWKDEEPDVTRGFHCINVTESYHPYYENWWPHGHIIGWENTFVHTALNMVNAVMLGTPLEPYVATFEDGYRNAVICDAMLKSSKSGKKEKIFY